MKKGLLMAPDGTTFGTQWHPMFVVHIMIVALKVLIPNVNVLNENISANERTKLFMGKHRAP